MKYIIMKNVSELFALPLNPLAGTLKTCKMKRNSNDGMFIGATPAHY
ncbi:MAG: hypothetical protein H0U27_12715 [Nitrosopumilus sp.]|nr:hypothetical protein [Nitrosopumilus sp.]